MTVFFLIHFPTTPPHHIWISVSAIGETAIFICSFVFLRKDLTVFQCASDWPGVYDALVQIDSQDLGLQAHTSSIGFLYLDSRCLCRCHKPDQTKLKK